MKSITPIKWWTLNLSSQKGLKEIKNFSDLFHLLRNDRYVIQSKTSSRKEAGLDLSVISRLNTSEKILGTHVTLLDKDMGTLGPLTHGVMSKLIFLRAPFAISFK